MFNSNKLKHFNFNHFNFLQRLLLWKPYLSIPALFGAGKSEELDVQCLCVHIPVIQDLRSKIQTSVVTYVDDR